MKHFMVGLLAFSALCGAAAGTVYVDRRNTEGPWDGASWVTAFRTIQEGVDASASRKSGEVWVAQGVYNEARRETDGALVLPDTVAVYGGFAGTETLRTQRDWKQWATVIDGFVARGGQQAYHVVVTGAQATLDGLVIRGGCANGATGDLMYGGGLAGTSSSLVLANCTFRWNRAAYGGGALYLSGGSQTVSDCVFSGNGVASSMSRTLGGAAYVYGGADASFVRCVFTSNSASSTFGDADAGAVFVDNASPSLKQCRFVDNVSSGHEVARGGAIVNEGNSIPTHPLIENCVFRNNRVVAPNAGSSGGGIYNGLGTYPSVVNCTFYGNVAPLGGGMSTYSYSSTPEVVNCIFWSDTGGEIVSVGTSVASVQFSDVEGGYVGGTVIDQDPLFIVPGAGDLGLSTGSPCIDAGTTYLAPAVDITGAVRPHGASNDMGAYEYPSRETPPIWYVDKEADGTQDGLSWTNAFTTIQAGIEAAYAAGGGRVYVAEGVYNETRADSTGALVLRSGVGVYGGFPNAAALAALEPQDRSPALHTTTIDGATARAGAPAHHVVIGANSAHLDGFVITGGNANGTDNVAQTMRGGGLYSSGASPTVSNCVFKGNAADYGGAVCLFSSAATFEQCVFRDNSARVDGAGVWDGTSSTPAFKNCLFAANSAARYGGGIFNYTESAAAVTNCTFYGNTGTDGGGAMSSWSAISPPTIVNSILWNDSPGELHAGSGTIQVSYSDVQGGYTGAHNLNVNPGFMHAAVGNLQLLPTSPCVDVGTASNAPNQDLNWTPRPQGTGVDLGAYESFSLAEGPVMAHLSMADDRITLYVNGTQVIETVWGDSGGVYTGHHPGDSGPVDISGYLQHGTNEIRVTVWNGAFCCGVSGILDLTVEGRMIYRNGVNAMDSTEGIKFDDTYILNWTGPDGDPAVNDLDRDLMPDAWETANGLNPMNPSDAMTDADGDGLTNRDEYLRGSDPNDPLDPEPTRFVSPAGVDSPGQAGTSAQPWQSISYALTRISPTSSSPITIAVAAGTYAEDLTLKDGTRVVARDGALVTIVGTVVGAEGARLSGVTLREPDSAAAGTVLLSLDNVGMQIERVTFQGKGARSGKGAVCEGAGPGLGLFTDCVFRSLDTGIEVFGAIPTVRRTLFEDIADVGLLIHAVRGGAKDGGEGTLGAADDPNSGWNTFRDLDGLAVDNERPDSVLAQRNNWGTDDPIEILAMVSGDVDTGYPLPKSASLVPASLVIVVIDATTKAAVTTASLDLSPGDFAPVTENTSGAYSFLCLEGGAYTVTVTASDYHAQTRTVTVNDGEQGTATVMLASSTEPPTPGGCGGAKALRAANPETGAPTNQVGGLAQWNATGTGARWLSFAGVLLLLSVCLGWLVRGKAGS